MELDRSYELHGEQVAAELCAAAAAFWGVGARKTERKGGEQNEEAPLVLKRARGRALGSFPALATAAARWRLAVAFWARGTGLRTPARGVEAVGSFGATRGRPQQAGGGSGALLRQRAALHSGGDRKQRKQVGGRRKWTGSQFQKIPGTQL